MDKAVKIKTRYIILVLTFLISIPVKGISIPELLENIDRNNLYLKTLDSNNSAREAELRSENVLPPTTIEYSPFFRPGINGVASSELIISQEFDFPSLYAARNKQATYERNVLDGEMAVERRNVLLEAQSAALDLILLQKENEILNAKLSDTDKLVEAYEKALQLGSATILEVNKVKLERQDIQRELLLNKADMENVTASIISMNGNIPLELNGLDYEKSVDQLECSENIEYILGKNPSLQTAIMQFKAADNNLKLAKSSWLPAFTLGYRRNTEEKMASNGLIIGATLPLFTNSAHTKAAKARYTADKFAMESKAIEIAAQYRQQIEQLKLQKATLETYDLELLKETLKLYRKSLNAGQINLTTFYIETSVLYERLLSRAKLENSIQQTYARLMANNL